MLSLKQNLPYRYIQLTLKTFAIQFKNTLRIFTFALNNFKMKWKISPKVSD